ncbi:hypothetical protein SELMODRAFT_270463 [Selaginella moellendorffii]|uniref:MaoC-like domain-containing protein n=1 Tax=Selaginella moellendorffii TaxID=88036 RepID=D8R0P0_SELML|nr:hypothetical protein SELMODRAFT_270463 [Selaginella moellendorffii]
MLLKQAWRRTNSCQENHRLLHRARRLATGNAGPEDAISADRETLKSGARFTATRAFSQDDLAQYSGLSGDSNPIHTQRSSAQAAGFAGGCVVHGMLTAGLFPAIIGSNFPGAIYVSQTLKFQQPAFAGDDLVAQVTVLDCVRIKRHYKVTFATSCFKCTTPDAIVVDGTAVALLPG